MSVKTKMIKKTKKKTQCFVCGKAVANLKVHSYVHDQPTECSVCGTKLAGPFSLKRHMDTKHAEKTYECYLCNKTFGAKYALTKHIKTHNKVKCTICDDVVSEAYLQVHMTRHSPKFKCPKCPLTFAYQYLLTKHRCATFECTLCNISLSCKSSLGKHMKKRHSNTLPKCNSCLHRHIRKSSCTFTCGWCFEHFTLLKLVQLHQLIECVHGPRIQPNDTVLMIPEDDEPAQNVDMVDPIELSPPSPLSEATTTAFSLLTSDYALERKVDDSLTSFEQSKTLSSPTPTSSSPTPTSKLSTEATSNDAALAPQLTDNVFGQQVDKYSETAFAPHFCAICGQHIKTLEVFASHNPCLLLDSE